MALAEVDESDHLTGITVFFHHPPQDPLPSKTSQLGDRREAAESEKKLGEFRESSGKVCRGDQRPRRSLPRGCRRRSLVPHQRQLREESGGHACHRGISPAGRCSASTPAWVRSETIRAPPTAWVGWPQRRGRRWTPSPSTRPHRWWPDSQLISPPSSPKAIAPSRSAGQQRHSGAETVSSSMPAPRWI